MVRSRTSARFSGWRRSVSGCSVKTEEARGL
jgi:hypothetical protein